MREQIAETENAALYWKGSDVGSGKSECGRISRYQ